MAESNFGQGSSSAGVMHQTADDSLHVAIALSKVVHTELGSALAVLDVGLEDTPRTLSLC